MSLALSPRSGRNEKQLNNDFSPLFNMFQCFTMSMLLSASLFMIVCAKYIRKILISQYVNTFQNFVTLIM